MPFLRLLDKTKTFIGEQALIKQWIDRYWQPGNHSIVQEDPAGPKDKRYVVDIEDGIRAILSVNHMLSYIGLIVEYSE